MIVTVPQQWGAGDIMYADINGDGKVDGGKGTLADPSTFAASTNSVSRDGGAYKEYTPLGFTVSLFNIFFKSLFIADIF